MYQLTTNTPHLLADTHYGEQLSSLPASTSKSHLTQNRDLTLKMELTMYEGAGMEWRDKNSIKPKIKLYTQERERVCTSGSTAVNPRSRAKHAPRSRYKSHVGASHLLPHKHKQNPCCPYQPDQTIYLLVNCKHKTKDRQAWWCVQQPLRAVSDVHVGRTPNTLTQP